MCLSQHGAKPTHLKHQPLQHGKFFFVGCAEKAIDLARQINEDRARFKQGYWLSIRAIRVNDGGDFVVRRDGKEFRFELIALTNIDVVRTLGESALFEHDVYFVAVWRGHGIGFDHLLFSQ
jgi:hypothetical protein